MNIHVESCNQQRDSSIPTVVVPGDLLGSRSNLIPGRGTYVSNGFVYSALLGYVSETPCAGDANPFVHVVRLTQLTEQQRIDDDVTTNHLQPSTSPWAVGALPVPGDYVYARVVRVDPNRADVDILLSEPTSIDRICITPYRGTLRAQDIRSHSFESINISECFQPGDIIRAFVLSSCDTRGGFLLSTSSMHCGVLFAKSLHGELLQPVAHDIMRCPKTQKIELRKVCHPQAL